MFGGPNHANHERREEADPFEALRQAQNLLLRMQKEAKQTQKLASLARSSQKLPHDKPPIKQKYR